MLLSLVLITAIAAGGFAITYLLDDDEPFLWRFAAGTVIGSAAFGTLCFLLAMAAGLNAVTVGVSLAITLLPIVLILRGPRRKIFQRDWDRAKGKTQGANSAKVLRFLYYAAFLVLFILFFAQSMYETEQGIFTGGSNNLGDLPFHLGAILSFTDGANFPPQNPSFAGAKFSYPFISDLLTACFIKLGAPLRDAMVVQNIAWTFALLVVLERFVMKLTGDRLAARFGPPLLFLSGGFGFIWFFGDFGAQSKGLVELLAQLPKDYTIGDQFRWGNAMVTLFITQRSLLLGMPLTLIVLGVLWRIFTAETQRRGDDLKDHVPIIAAGVLAGLLPLVHLHSLAVLFVVTGVLFFMRLDRWREWIVFGAGVCVVAVPQLAWSLTGSASETTKFFEWHFGWDSRDLNIFWFWIKNTGIFIPIVAVGIYLSLIPRQSSDAKDEGAKKDRGEVSNLHPTSLLLFYVPFVLLFVISNVAKLAPWEWDNIKVLIYWWVGSIPFVAFALAWLWRHSVAMKVIAGLCLVVLVLSGSLDVLRTVTGAVKMNVFNGDAVKLAQRIKSSAPPRALILNAPTYNSVVVLTGRPSLIRYLGHLSSHGIDYVQREAEAREVYAGGPAADSILGKYGVDYVVVGPEERGYAADPGRPMRLNEAYFRKFPIAAEVGAYRVYKVR